jgi:hypothetical protein
MDTPDITSFARQRLAQGMGVELRIVRRTASLRLLLLPSALYSLDAQRSLAITCEEYGLYVWDGLNPLDVFDLVTAGFPLSIAEAVAELIGEILPVRFRRKLNSPQGQQKGVSPQLGETNLCQSK